MRFLLLFLLSITNSVTFALDYPTMPVRITAATAIQYAAVRRSPSTL